MLNTKTVSLGNCIKVVVPSHTKTIFLQSITMDLKPDPIKILDLATIVKSPTEPDKGPSFFIGAKNDPVYFEVSNIHPPPSLK